MIATLRRFYRRHFSSPTEAKFLELFESCINLSRAIVLQEVSLLAGITVTYVWQEFPEYCRLTAYEVNMKKRTHRAIAERDLPKTEVTDVLRQIDEGGGAALGNFSGTVKDGVRYSLCWGSPSSMVALSIKNPQYGSERHQKFISALRKRATGMPQ